MRPFSMLEALDGDAQREVERTARSDEGSRQLKIGARVDEHPCVLVAVAEEAELVEAPADDPLVLDGQLERLMWVLRRRHVHAETTGTRLSCWQNVRPGCGGVARRRGYGR